MKFLTNFLHQDHWPTQEATEALKRLLKARWDPESNADVIIKAAADLDTAFFAGTLCRNPINVRWLNPERDTELFTDIAARTRGLEGLKAETHLHRHCILRGEYPIREMWSALIHEMIVSRIYTMPD